MEAWKVLVLVALAASTVYAVTEVTFPEVVNERLSSRIVSGWEAEEGQYPYQMSLRMVSPIGGVSSCGATIIHESWGLTAAHCTAGRESFVLRAGVVNLTRPALIFETTKFYNHPLYDNSRPAVVQPHDIGLLEFGRKIEFSNVVQPIRLQRSAAQANSVEYTDQQLVATGWGRTWTDGSAPENMNWVFLVGVPHLECITRFAVVASESTICARYYNVTSQSTCQGDSGGGLTVVDDDGAVSQIGISSFVSSTGCHTEIPAGFIQPGYYHEWYTEVTGENFDWTYDVPTTEAASTTEGASTTDATSTTASTEDEDCEDEDDESSESSSEEEDSSSSQSSSEEDEATFVRFA